MRDIQISSNNPVYQVMQQ